MAISSPMRGAAKRGLPNSTQRMHCGHRRQKSRRRPPWVKGGTLSTYPHTCRLRALPPVRTVDRNVKFSLLGEEVCETPAVSCVG